MTMLKKKFLVKCDGLEMWFESKGGARKCLLTLQDAGLDPHWFMRA